MTFQLNAATRLAASNEDYSFKVDAAVAIEDGDGFTAQTRKHLLSQVEEIGKDVAKKASPSFWHNSDSGEALNKYQKLVIAARQLYKEIVIATDMEQIRHVLSIFAKFASFDAGVKSSVDKVISETKKV